MITDKVTLISQSYDVQKIFCLDKGKGKGLTQKLDIKIIFCPIWTHQLNSCQPSTKLQPSLIQLQVA